MSDMTIFCEPPMVVSSSCSIASFDTIEEARAAVPEVLEKCENNFNEDDIDYTHGPSPKNFRTVNDMKVRILEGLLTHDGKMHRAHLFPSTKMTDEQKGNYKLAESKLQKMGLITVQKSGRGHTVYLKYKQDSEDNAPPMAAVDPSLVNAVRQEIRVGFVNLRSELLKNIDTKRASRFPLLEGTTEDNDAE